MRFETTALYNEDDAAKSIGVDFTLLGWTASTKATVRDLWAKTDMPAATGMIKNVTIAAHGVKLFLLKEA